MCPNRIKSDLYVNEGGGALTRWSNRYLYGQYIKLIEGSNQNVALNLLNEKKLSSFICF